ncbi:MAG TPA: VOC family protein [Thermomonospora sp.]|nr:VOC family protein [Thermomonospora sp.]
MASTWNWLVIDCADPRPLAEFWSRVLDFKILEEDEESVALGVDAGTYPKILFLRVPDPKTVKNRLHLDLTPDDQAAEVERILALGARRVDIGQGEQSWVVLADPEGNEFCVLSGEGG